MSIRLYLALFLALAVPAVAFAQQDHDDEPAPQQAPQHQHETPAAQHQHGQDGAASLFSGQDGSGTSWLPAATPMYAWHGRAGQWELMAHGNFFLQYLHEYAEEHRGSSQTGSINWGMGMARRAVGAGRLGLRAMLSAEPATIGGCGYPDLLATGELCDGETIHDLQHPHDFVMELAADYERPFGDGFRLQLYGGLAGEPALGPVAFPHRLSALPNPIAPIGHHWLDATHITFGVVTAGVFSSRWKMEASVFNGREPDEDRWDLDLARPDSFSARLSLAPSPSVAIQVSAGHLNDAEPAHGAVGRVDVTRVTASVAYHRQMGAASYWTSTAAWGRNLEEGEATHAGLIESNLTFSDRHTWFGRLELAGKPSHALHVEEIDAVFTVAKLQAGYTRYFAGWRGLAAGLGGVFSASIVPPYLAPRYDGRISPGIGVFLTVRPAAHRM